MKPEALKDVTTAQKLTCIDLKSRVLVVCLSNWWVMSIDWLWTLTTEYRFSTILINFSSSWRAHAATPRASTAKNCPWKCPGNVLEFHSRKFV